MVFGLLLLLAANSAPAEPVIEQRAETVAGQEQPGRLALRDERWVFEPQGGAADGPLPWERLRRIRLTCAMPPASPSEGPWLELWAGQRIPGELIGWRDGEAILGGSVFDPSPCRVPSGVLSAAHRGGGAIPRSVAGHRGLHQDALVLSSGDRLFGRLDRLGDDGLWLAVPADAAPLRIDDWASVQLARPRAPLRSLSGAHVRLELQSNPLENEPAGDRAPARFATAVDVRIDGVLRSVAERSIVVEHPYLGRLQFATAAAAELRPLFYGQRIELAPGNYHQGNQLMPEWEIAAPDEPLELTFELPVVPAGAAYVALEAEQLEPADSARFARQLAGGYLQTKLVVNGQDLGPLNAHVAGTGPAQQRLRVALPAGLLRSGPNTLRIQQTGQPDDPQEFDDCLLGRFALEVEPRP